MKMGIEAFIFFSFFLFFFFFFCGIPPPYLLYNWGDLLSRQEDTAYNTRYLISNLPFLRTDCQSLFSFSSTAL